MASSAANTRAGDEFTLHHGDGDHHRQRICTVDQLRKIETQHKWTGTKKSALEFYWTHRSGGLNMTRSLGTRLHMGPRDKPGVYLKSSKDVERHMRRGCRDFIIRDASAGVPVAGAPAGLRTYAKIETQIGALMDQADYRDNPVNAMYVLCTPAYAATIDYVHA
jgi:hypothetical protein